MKLTITIFSTLVLITAVSHVALACSCTGYPTSCQAYTNADAVFTGTVDRLEAPTPTKDGNGNEYVAGQIAHVQVETVFKGAKLVEAVFRSGGSSCDPTYKEGQRWLFYAYLDKDSGMWEIYGCDRSRRLDEAEQDLMYLRALPSSQARTRFSGVLQRYEEDPLKGFSLSENLMGLKVKISSESKTYEVYTDKNGVYEIYDLPPGPYSVEPEVPPGLKIRFPMFYGGGGFRQLNNQRATQLQDHGCAEVSFVFSADTSVSGTLFGSNGQPLPEVCLNLTPKGMDNIRNRLFSCTDKDGKYKVNQIPPGDYVIVVNYDGRLSGNAPFPLAYYPGVFERDKATTLTISAGDNLRDYDIHIPSQEATKVIQGVLLYNDGRPVARGFVEFKADTIKEGYSGEVHASTDAQGRFRLTVLQGLKGIIRGFMYSYVGEFINCPKLDKLLKEKNVMDVGTKPMRLEVNRDIQDFKLVFPFPSCARATPN